MKISFILSLGLILFNSIDGVAQETKTEPVSDSSHWQAGIDFLNDNVYFGRKDSARLSYITPSIGYYDKSGLFIDASLSYLSSQENNRIDLFTIEGGYSYLNNNFEVQVLGNKYFYNSNSTSIKSEVKGSVDAYIAYDLNFLKPSFEVTGSFSSKSDIDLTLGLEHTFYTPDSKLNITPSFSVNAGTRNFFASYSDKRSLPGLRKKKNANGSNIYTITAQVQDASQVKLLDYEIALPINYAFHKFSFNVTAFYAIPVNPAITVTTIKAPSTATRTTTNAENLANVFFYSIGVAYNFR